ncbi:MAG: aldo/keto reductase [Planctomycetaceae bacterium]|jgi:L-galactose dehydrogenase|nr:aldo/keto reductase [Planctomycetaceae bacterium]
MKHRHLGNTDMDLSVVSYGASSLGAEFRSVDVDEALAAVPAAIECGMNFIDTSPYYGRGSGEVLLGIALKDIPRDQYYLGTKLGRYHAAHFDFSAKRVVESVDVSLHRLGTDYLDVILCHDIEFVERQQIVDETLPALRKIQQQGKVRYVGISGYPMSNFKFILDQTDLDVVLSYNHYTLQNTMFNDLVPYLESKGVGIINAAPFSARLLTNAPLPPWHKATPLIRETCQKAAQHSESAGVDIAQLALQFSIANPNITTCVTGSANQNRIRQWAEWAETPLDQQLLQEVQKILEPIHNWFYIEGRPENNDPQPTSREECHGS